MVKRMNKKSGFSLAEALISMLVVSVFFMATSKIITTKPKKEIEQSKHGYFECYVEDNVMKQKRSDGSFGATPVTVASGHPCRFTPPNGVAFFVIYALNTTEDVGKGFYVSQESQINSEDGIEEITIDSDELTHFQDYMDEAGKPNTSIYPLINFFESSYPSSSIYHLLKTDQGVVTDYAGPAVFIGW